MHKQLLINGRKKSVYATEDPTRVVVQFKDIATAFCGIKIAKIAGKGKINNAISSLLMAYLEEHGIHTVFLKKLSECEQLYLKVETIPIDIVLHNVFAGTLAKRLGVEEGQPTKNVIVDVNLDSDELGNPMINDDQAVALGIVSLEELLFMKDVIRKANDLLKPLFASVGIVLVNFSLKFGRDSEGRIFICDEITPDTCRLWDAKTNERLDKDRFCHDLGNVAEVYSDVLNRISVALKLQ
ncbi:MAG: phosphoribosylaminoimidazolesuccinocarboxamide synthase [Alistipes sp.]|nr:phosphoribosylaminoimidazolesuccinocarboxamide synthase [Candidatus Alistipes equi]